MHLYLPWYREVSKCEVAVRLIILMVVSFKIIGIMALASRSQRRNGRGRIFFFFFGMIGAAFWAID
jgi:hypothetical protein